MNQENGLPAENLTFGPFVDYLEKLNDEGNTLKQHYLQQVVSQFMELTKDTSCGRTSKNPAVAALFELTDQTLSLNFDGANTAFDVYTTPASAGLLFIRQDLPGILRAKDERDPFIRCLVRYLKNEKELRSALCYRAIWNYFAEIPCLLLPEIIMPYKSQSSGQQNYFKLNADLNFLAIESGVSPVACQQIIEEIDATTISTDEVHQRLKDELPLSLFDFTGFGRISVQDVTVPHITKLLARRVVSASAYKEEFAYLSDIREALQVVAGNSRLHFGLLPMFQLNGKYIFSEQLNIKTGTCNFSLSNKKNLFDYLINEFRLKPHRVYLKEITNDLTHQFEYLDRHKQNGIRSFALLPVFFHDQLVGVLEVYTDKAEDLSKTTLAKLETFFPVLSTIFKRSIDSLDQMVQEVIKTQFTSLQPSVQWRFNQAAWHYIQDTSAGSGPAEIEDIEFEKVYPLYGAVDIRNSTVNRNRAFREDAVHQLQMLNETLNKLKDQTSFGLLDEKLSDCKNWQERLDDETQIVQEGELNYFFEREVECFLRDLSHGKPEINHLIEIYFDAINESDGVAFEKRRMLEQSMGAVIKATNDLVDDIQEQAQQAYPCFFEKFRTDGVEYDIYIGQSIAPEQAFKHLFIQNLRLLQLTNMIAIARRIHILQPQLAMPIETTQLIFAYPNFIDIRFRRDERRFDVEGAYNIRYHIVKKRIDKVQIKNTNERLTAPGKIAIVYFNQKDADEYLVHIQYLQKGRLLTDEVESLELEQLQGVIGLKALRVTVRCEDFNN